MKKLKVNMDMLLWAFDDRKIRWRASNRGS